MIANLIIKAFDGWDEIGGDEDRTIYYNVTLQDAYNHLNTLNYDIDLFIDDGIGFIELISRDDESKIKSYMVDTLTFKEKA